MNDPKLFRFELIPSDNIAGEYQLVQGIGYPRDVVRSEDISRITCVFINKKQIETVKKRRDFKQKKYNAGLYDSGGKKGKFKYESRHVHALNRRRGEDGRFCSKNNQGDVLHTTKIRKNESVIEQPTVKSLTDDIKNMLPLIEQSMKPSL